MRGTAAKKLRKQVYGEDGSHRFREYKRTVRYRRNALGKRVPVEYGNIYAGQLRRAYQKLKKAYYARQRAA